MITQAVVLADMSRNHLEGKFNKVKALKSLLGLSFVKRTILNAHAVGVKDITVVLGYKADKVKGKLTRDKQLGELDLNISYVLNEDYEKSDSLSILACKEQVKGDFLLLKADTVFHKEILVEASKKFEQAQTDALVCIDAREPEEYNVGRVVFLNRKDSVLKEFGYARKEFGEASTGIFALNDKIFDKIQAVRDEKGDFFRIYDIFQGKELETFDIGERFWHHIETQDDYSRAESKLMNSVRKATDGVVSRNLNRYISLFMSKWLLKIKAFPNIVTVGNLIIGMLSAYYIAQGGYFYSLIGGVFFQFASITDGCDGEIAKLTFRSSKFGEWFDTTCDNLTYVAFLVGLPIGLHRTGSYTYLVLGLLTFVAAVTFVLMMVQYMKNADAGGSLVKIVKDIEADAVFDLSSLKKTLAFVISKVAFMMRRDFFAFFFLVLCLLGLSFMIQWLATFALLFACVYFFFYSRHQLSLMAIKA